MKRFNRKVQLSRERNQRLHFLMEVHHVNIVNVWDMHETVAQVLPCHGRGRTNRNRTRRQTGCFPVWMVAVRRVPLLKSERGWATTETIWGLVHVVESSIQTPRPSANQSTSRA